MNNIMKEVKIEYNKILLPFRCGLTAFSNLLQHTRACSFQSAGCGLTAFSNLLQRRHLPSIVPFLLRLDRIF